MMLQQLSRGRQKLVPLFSLFAIETQAKLYRIPRSLLKLSYAVVHSGSWWSAALVRAQREALRLGMLHHDTMALGFPTMAGEF
ncbi:hypothetical protein TB2_006455 [Malus domestica]